MTRSSHVLLLLPSLRISGGVAEALKFGKELAERGANISVISFWKHAHELDTQGLTVQYLLTGAPVKSKVLRQLPTLAIRFLRVARSHRKDLPAPTLVLTHFTTLLMAWLQPGLRRVCFNQDLEWLFVDRGWKRKLLRRAIVATCRRSTVIATNGFVAEQFEAEGVAIFGIAAIWADSKWLASTVSESRETDVIMLLRNSPFKRLDLSIELLRWLTTMRSLRITVITPEDNIAVLLASLPVEIMRRPADEEMKVLFGTGRLFVSLSEVEGFGLPPLEAMGSGCIPLCRDSGGVRNYLQGEFASMLVPRAAPIEEIGRRVLCFLEKKDMSIAQGARDAFARGLLGTLDIRRETLDRLASLLATDCAPK